MTTETLARPVDFPPAEQPQNSWDFLLFAWRRKWIVVVIAMMALGLGYLYFLGDTPLYQSTAQILIIQPQAKLPIEGLEVTTGYDKTHEILIRSPKVVKLAVENYDLKSLPGIRESGNPEGAVLAGLAVSTESRDRRTGDIFELSYTSRSSEECPKVLVAIVEAYESFLSATYQNVSEEAIKFIREAKDGLEVQIRDAEKAYDEFRKQKSTLLYAGQEAMNVHEPRLAQIESIRSAAVLENSQMQAKIDSIQAAIKQGSSREALNLLVGQLQPDSFAPATATSTVPVATGVTKPTDDPLFPQLLEEQMLLERYGPDHPKVQALRKRMQLIREHQKALLEKEKEKSEVPETKPAREFFEIYVESLHERMKMNLQTITEMTELFKQESAAANALSADLARDESFRSEIDRKKRMFDVILKRLEEITLVQDNNAVKLELIHPPGLGYQIKPDLNKILLSSSMLGILAGLGLAFVVDQADRRFRSPDEIRNDLGLPVIGHIPVIPASETKKGAKTESGEPSTFSPVLRTVHHPRGRISEAYRAVRTALYFSTRGTGHQIIQITSPSPGDGKTTLASNLAVSIAQSGKRVLLVDADFRRPRCHRVFGISDDVGVTSVLDGSAELTDVIQECDVLNLFLLPCGKRPDNPSELLTSKRFEELLPMLRDKFDFVLIDTPPVLAVTDPLNVVPRVDGVLLVMRLSKSARAASHRALAALDELGANMLGVIVNGVGAGPNYVGYGPYAYGSYGYGGYGGYRYGYADNYRYGYTDKYSENDDSSYYEDTEEPSPASKNGKSRH